MPKPLYTGDATDAILKAIEEAGVILSEEQWEVVWDKIFEIIDPHAIDAYRNYN